MKSSVSNVLKDKATGFLKKFTFFPFRKVQTLACNMPVYNRMALQEATTQSGDQNPSEMLPYYKN